MAGYGVQKQDWNPGPRLLVRPTLPWLLPGSQGFCSLVVSWHPDEAGRSRSLFRPDHFVLRDPQ